MKFDLRLQSTDLQLTNKDGNETDYVLYEATGTQRDMQAKFVQSQHNKETGVTDMTNVKEHFLGMLMRDKESNTVVGMKFFIGVSGRIRDQLFEEAQLLSGMKTEQELYKLLMDREMQKIMQKQEAEENGEEYVDPDLALEEKMAEEEASGKE